MDILLIFLISCFIHALAIRIGFLVNQCLIDP